MPEIIAWPTAWYGVVSSRFYLSSGSQSSMSPWSGRRSIYGPHRQLWRCELQLPASTADRWKPISAFFSEAAGQASLIRIGDSMRTRPRYNLENTLSEQAFSDGTFFDDGTGWLEGGVPSTLHVVTAAARGSTILHVGGLAASQSRLLRRGDLIEPRRDGIADDTPSLHEVLRDAPTDANGETLLKIAPGLRKGVAAGDMVVLDYATTVFRCVDDEQGIVQRDMADIGQAGFSLIENII